MQQGGSQYGVSPEIPPFAAAAAPTASRIQMQGGGSTDQTHQSVAEEASPISSRPPAGNFDELMPVVPADDEALAAGDETDRGGISGMNRWPRQETLALIKIRSEMDAAFRDATLKGPLWDEVSRKLAELGYSRSAKKCKEKFENVHKYYKRTKEGRAGRQDGKSYRFFSQLEALHGTGATTSNTNPPPPTVAFVSTTTSTHPTSASTAATINLHATPVSVGIGISTPMPLSSVPVPFSISTNPTQAPLNIGAQIFAPDYGVGMAPAAISASARAAAATPAAGANVRSSFSYDGSSSSSSSGSEEENEEEEFDFEGDPSRPESSRGRKRKRGSTTRGGLSSSQRIMEFFESLMKQVMQKQEAMQQRFLESIEKREQDRMIREEAWKRQEMARLAREHELMAQERAIAASRDSAIIAFLQKVTGQTIQLPHSTINIPSAPPPPPPPSATMSPPPVQQQHHRQHKQSEQHQQQQQQQHRSQQQQEQQQEQENQPIISSEALLAVPEQQVPPQETSGGGGGSLDPTSSRWPKTEVLALIKLRSGLEGRYQEAGPKGPLWEEISAGMHRMGYKRSSKRCKEKWENINKYFKKVKESNKKRPEDAKTCPYFHELDALYRKKILGSGTSGGGGGGGGIGSSGSSFGNQNVPEPQQPESMALDSSTTSKEQNKGDGNDMRVDNGGLTESLFRDGKSSAGEIAKKPEDIVKELMELQQQQQQHLQLRHQLMTDEYGRAEEPESENPNQEEDENYEDETDDEESEEERKMSFKIEFQRQNPGPSNRGGNGAPSFVAMVQ